MPHEDCHLLYLLVPQVPLPMFSFSGNKKSILGDLNFYGKAWLSEKDVGHVQRPAQFGGKSLFDVSAFFWILNPKCFPCEYGLK